MTLPHTSSHVSRGSLPDRAESCPVTGTPPSARCARSQHPARAHVSPASTLPPCSDSGTTSAPSTAASGAKSSSSRSAHRALFPVGTSSSSSLATWPSQTSAATMSSSSSVQQVNTSRLHRSLQPVTRASTATSLAGRSSPAIFVTLTVAACLCRRTLPFPSWFALCRNLSNMQIISGYLVDALGSCERAT